MDEGYSRRQAVADANGAGEHGRAFKEQLQWAKRVFLVTQVALSPGEAEEFRYLSTHATPAPVLEGVHPYKADEKAQQLRDIGIYMGRIPEIIRKVESKYGI